MSSSPRADGQTATRGSVLAPRTWSLRVRLIVTQMVLLAVVIAGIGAATEFALQRFLSHQLDEQLQHQLVGRLADICHGIVTTPGHPSTNQQEQPDDNRKD